MLQEREVSECKAPWEGVHRGGSHPVPFPRFREMPAVVSWWGCGLVSEAFLTYRLVALHAPSICIMTHKSRVYFHTKFDFHSSPSSKNHSGDSIQTCSSSGLFRGSANASCWPLGRVGGLTLLHGGCTGCPISTGEATWQLASGPVSSPLHLFH